MSGSRRAERFVQQEQRGSSMRSAHEADALPLAAGQLHGIMIEQLGGESSQLGQFRQPFVNAFALPAEMASQERDVAARRQVGEESAVLDDETDAAAQSRGLAGVTGTPSKVTPPVSG